MASPTAKCWDMTVVKLGTNNFLTTKNEIERNTQMLKLSTVEIQPLQI